MELEKVLILLIDYNTSHFTPDVLKSIQETEVDVTILIVDNGSSEASYRQLQKIDDPRVHLVRLDKNVGFTRGNNLGLSYALKNLYDFKYVFLLNTDAFSEPNLIGGLKEILDANKNAACISPKILARDGSIWYGGSKINFEKGKVTQSIDIKPDSPVPFHKVDVFNGCAVLFRTDRFIEAGLLNEDLFMYYEEADCSLKLRKLGYEILYAPAFNVLHYISAASRNVSHIKTYYMTRNKFMVFNNTMSLKNKIFFLTYELAYNLKHKRFKNAIYHLKGFIDFKKGKIGQINSVS